MTSKEALERLNEKLLRYDEHYDYADIELIKQDIDRLEKIIEILKDILDIELWISKDQKYYLIECGYYKLLTQEEYNRLRRYF